MEQLIYCNLMDVNIDITYKNITSDEPLKVFVNEKIGGLEKFLKNSNELAEVRVEIGKPSRHHRSGRIYYAEANMKIGSKLLRATCQHEDLRNAIVDVKNELQERLKQFKDRKRDISRKPKE